MNLGKTKVVVSGAEGEVTVSNGGLAKVILKGHDPIAILLQD